MNTQGLAIFYGRNAALARELGVPIFLDGDTGEVVKTPWSYGAAPLPEATEPGTKPNARSGDPKSKPD